MGGKHWEDRYKNEQSSGDGSADFFKLDANEASTKCTHNGRIPDAQNLESCLRACEKMELEGPDGTCWGISFKGSDCYYTTSPCPATRDTSNDNHLHKVHSCDAGGCFFRLAGIRMFKQKIINQVVRDYNIQKVVEFGVGDGVQLEIGKYPRYVGVDVSKTVVESTTKKFGSDKSKSFIDLETYINIGDYFQADLGMSLDVLYHLVEWDIFREYLDRLFNSANSHVLIYACDEDQNSSNDYASHVAKRRFNYLIEKYKSSWKLKQKWSYPKEFMDPSCAEMFLYEKLKSITEKTQS